MQGVLRRVITVGAPLASRRALSASVSLRAVQQVTPEKAFQDVNAGLGVIVDLRSDNDGIKIHPSAVVLPYEAVLGSDSGLAAVPGKFPREELLKMLTPEQLHVDSYHEVAKMALEKIRVETGNKDLDHAGAQKYIADRLALFEKPAEFWKQVSSEQSAKHAAKIKAMRAAYASGKVPAETTAFIKSQREAFDRYLKLNSVTPNRFLPLGGDAAANDNYNFQDAVLASVRSVGGQQLDHAAAHALLKKRLTGNALKSDKDFFETFFADFATESEAARVKAQMRDKGSKTSLSADDVEFLSHEKQRVSSYLKYKAHPSNAELAEGISDETLRHLAGVYNANLGDHAKQVTRDNARAALKSLPSTRPLFLIDLASVQAIKVAELLAEAGGGDVRVVAGGLDRWLSRGLSCEPTSTTAVALEQQLVANRRNMPQIAEIND